MERELLITGIGGQGVQLAAQVLARAATLEGRERHVPRPLRRHDARRQHRQHRRRRRRADRSAAGRVARVVGDRDARRVLGADRSRSCGPTAFVLVNDATFTTRSAAASRCSASPATNVATDLGNPLGGVDGDARRVLRTHRHRRRSTRSSRRCGSRSRRTARNTSKPTNARCAPGWELLPANAYPAWERTRRMPDVQTEARSRAAAPSRSTSSTARAATSASPRARRACSRCRRR